jgi:enoyl-CoA hydratase/carnithine racemase
MADSILLEQRPDGAAIVTFNRPAVHNALDRAAMRAFAHVVAELAAELRDPASPMRAVILTGAGTKAFCSGGDLADLATQRAADEAAAMIRLMGDALLALERLPVPVIAAINGHALGGGSEIALACDLRVLDETARLGLLQTRRGLITGWGGGQRLLRLLGYPRALDALLSARVFTAPEALAAGLANRVVPAGEALAGALALVETIAALDSAVVRAVKAALRAGLLLPFEAAIEAERALFPPLWVGDTHVQSLETFIKGQRQP